MAGYSKTSLIDKLGIKEQMKVTLINHPPEYFSFIEKDVSSQIIKAGEQPDFVHLFVTTRKELEHGLNNLLALIKPTSVIWVSWYKKSAGIPTDVTEDTIRAVALKTILVDVKVCAINDTWSGLKLVVRKENRNF